MLMVQLRRLALLAVVLSLLVVWAAEPASAHTGFESSDPADGAVLAEPVDVITIVFSGAAEPTGSGFEALDADGGLRSPSETASSDGRTWVLRFEPALDGGAIGVRWSVKAPDAHPINGAFSFTTPSLPSDAVDPGLPAPAADATGAPSTAGTESAATTEAQQLEDFLDSGSASTAGPKRLATAGRVLSYGGALLGVGALVFVATVLRGDGNDIRYGIFWVRRLGLVVMIGVAMEFAAQLALEAGGWSGMWSPATVGAVLGSSFAIAMALRFAGGMALSSGSRMAVGTADDSLDPVIAIRDLVPVGAMSTTVHGTATGSSSMPPAEYEEPYQRPGDAAWVPDAASSAGFVGAAMLLASHLFDGHTVSKGTWAITSLFSLIHVGAAAVWVGGVVMLVAVLWRRTRQQRPLRSLQLAVRFSVVATIALAAVAIAGLVLAVIILDGVSELWTTPWGRLLMLKTGLVGFAACGGAYNHKVLIPELGEDETLSPKFRTAVTLEAIALGLVLVVTAFLVGAAS
jgi:copper transport protein